MWLRICKRIEKLKMKIMKNLIKSKVMYVKENVKINYAPIRKISFGRNFVVRKFVPGCVCVDDDHFWTLEQKICCPNLDP